MIKFPAQYHSYRKTTLGENIIQLSVDRAYSQDILELIGKEIGTQFVVHLEDVTQDTNLHRDPDELQVRFMNKLHVLLAELANIKDVKPAKAKEVLRTELKNRKLIEKSTTELDVKGLAIACNIVEEWINKYGTIE